MSSQRSKRTNRSTTDDNQGKGKRQRTSTVHADQTEDANETLDNQSDDVTSSKKLESSSKKSKKQQVPTTTNKKQTPKGKDTPSAKVRAPKLILFIGNIPHGTTEAEIREFFQDCAEEILGVRIRKEGYCFLELSTSAAVQKALLHHHKLLKERPINVCLTAGGGGKSAARMEKIRERNQRLEEERTVMAEKKKQEKEALRLAILQKEPSAIWGTKKSTRSAYSSSETSKPPIVEKQKLNAPDRSKNDKRKAKSVRGW